MKLRRFFILLLIVLAAISFRFPEAFDDISLNLPFSAMEADAEVGSTVEFHNAILDAISEVKENIKIRIVKYDEKDYDINFALDKILDENAGLGFVAGCSASFTQVPGKDSAVADLKLKYHFPREKVINMREETANKAKQIIRNIIKPGMSDYEKVLAVHDHIIINSVYDRLNTEKDTVPPEEHEAYGVLVKGTGVCDSYAKALKLLLSEAGIECMLIEGSKAGNMVQGPGGVDHGWNIVKLEGEYYHIDATWDDVSEEKDSADVSYNHFNLNDEEMQKTHIWDKSMYPKCTGTKYNYFSLNRLIADNKAEFCEMLVKAISARDRRILVKIADYKSTEYNIEKLIKRAAEKSRLRQGIRVRWTLDEALGIVEIEFTY